MNPGDRVRCSMRGELDGVEGIVINPPPRASNYTRPRTWIRWDTRILACGYPENHPILDQIEVIR